jgi:hypothetical protein
VVLVHGAFADSSSWNGVIKNLEGDGYRVISAANPLRGLHTDAAYVRSVLDSVSGPVVLAGHSYGVGRAAAAHSPSDGALPVRPGCLAPRSAPRSPEPATGSTTGARRNTGQPISVRHLSASPVSRGPTW